MDKGLIRLILFGINGVVIDEERGRESLHSVDDR